MIVDVKCRDVHNPRLDIPKNPLGCLRTAWLFFHLSQG